MMPPETTRAWVDGREVRLVDGPEMHTETASTDMDYTEWDPAWSYTDADGHWHAWAEKDRLPTLEARTRPCDGACGDPDHQETYYVCAACAEEIEPGWIVKPGPHEVITGEWLDLTVDVEGPDLDVSGRTSGIHVHVEYVQPTGPATTHLFGMARGLRQEIRVISGEAPVAVWYLRFDDYGQKIIGRVPHAGLSRR